MAVALLVSLLAALHPLRLHLSPRHAAVRLAEGPDAEPPAAPVAWPAPARTVVDMQARTAVDRSHP